LLDGLDKKIPIRQVILSKTGRKNRRWKFRAQINRVGDGVVFEFEDHGL
jgi:hypothetical protein